MSTSTDAILCFGINIEEGFGFPWGEEYGGEVEEWWLYEVCRYKNPYELYDKNGKHLSNANPERIRNFYAEKRAALLKNPLPVEVVTHCSDGCPMYIIAALGSPEVAWRGGPRVINPAEMEVSEENKTALIQFCRSLLGLEVSAADAAWWLASYWG